MGGSPWHRVVGGVGKRQHKQPHAQPRVQAVTWFSNPGAHHLSAALQQSWAFFHWWQPRGTQQCQLKAPGMNGVASGSTEGANTSETQASCSERVLPAGILTATTAPKRERKPYGEVNLIGLFKSRRSGLRPNPSPPHPCLLPPSEAFHRNQASWFCRGHVRTKARSETP